MITNVTRCTREIKCRIAMAKVASNRKTFHHQVVLKLKEETNKEPHLAHSFVVLMMWHFRKIYRKCGAGEEWRISVEPIV
jgi:hypothetical protein